MLSRPVRYDKKEKAILGADHLVICHPFQKVGLPDFLFHEIGEEIAECINDYEPPHLRTLPVNEPLETQAEATPVDPGEAVKRKPGRPKGKR